MGPVWNEPCSHKVHSLLWVHTFPLGTAVNLCQRTQKWNQSLTFTWRDPLLIPTHCCLQLADLHMQDKSDINWVFMQTSNPRHTKLWSLERVLFLQVRKYSWLGVPVSWRNSLRRQRLFWFIIFMHFSCLDWSSGSCSSSFRVFRFENNRKW